MGELRVVTAEPGASDDAREAAPSGVFRTGTLRSTERGPMVGPADLPERLPPIAAAPSEAARLPEGGLDLRAAVEAFENGLVLQALDRTGWNKNRAARLLGLNRTTLVEMLKRKGLRAPER
jgi:DNA-binding NtrC family response regulator